MSVSIDFRARVYSALNAASVTDLLDDYDTGKALFGGLVIPQDCAGYKTINFYMSGPINAAEVAPTGRYSINCRAQTEGEALTIAAAVTAAVNRVSFGDYYVTVSALPVLPPADDTDVFNAPLELTVKQR